MLRKPAFRKDKQRIIKEKARNQVQEIIMGIKLP